MKVRGYIMVKQKIIIAGVGGRGVLLACSLLLECAFRKRIPILSADDYGMSQRGGSVVSHIKVGNFQSPLIGKEEADVLLAFERTEGYKNLPFLREGGLFIINSPLPSVESKELKTALERKHIRYYLVDADRMALEMGYPLGVNMILLGFFSAFSDILFTKEDLQQCILKKTSKKRGVDNNLKAFERGYQEALCILPSRSPSEGSRRSMERKSG
ncbi:MAG: indolepyruvate oxidoreductase subunit beta [Thermodesulfobacteriota bacterium]